VDNILEKKERSGGDNLTDFYWEGEKRRWEKNLYEVRKRGPSRIKPKKKFSISSKHEEGRAEDFRRARTFHQGEGEKDSVKGGEKGK